MKYTEALKRIREAGLEDESEILGAITGKMEEIVSSRNTAKSEAGELKSQVDSLNTLANALGLSAEEDGKQWSEKVAQMSEAIAKLKTENTGLNEKLTTRAQSIEDLQKQLSAKDKKIKVFNAANLAGVNPRVLELMAQDVELEISEGKVMVKAGEDETQELKEFVKASPDWSPLMNSLYPEKGKQRLPDGSSSMGGDSSVKKITRSLPRKYGLYQWQATIPEIAGYHLGEGF